jgi:hypothetical protein
MTTQTYFQLHTGNVSEQGPTWLEADKQAMINGTSTWLLTPHLLPSWGPCSTDYHLPSKAPNSPSIAEMCHFGYSGKQSCTSREKISEGKVLLSLRRLSQGPGDVGRAESLRRIQGGSLHWKWTCCSGWGLQRQASVLKTSSLTRRVQPGFT